MRPYTEKDNMIADAIKIFTPYIDGEYDDLWTIVFKKNTPQEALDAYETFKELAHILNEEFPNPNDIEITISPNNKK